jgi:hypothetical protein
MIKTALNLLTVTAFIIALLTIGCSAQTEEQALQSLRQMSRENQLPPENVVAGIESRFAGKRTGALAKLLHARIRFENGDFTGAAAMLDTDVFRQKTSLGDYALWLRGRAWAASAAIQALPYYRDTNPNIVARSWLAVREVLADLERG